MVHLKIEADIRRDKDPRTPDGGAEWGPGALHPKDGGGWTAWAWDARANGGGRYRCIGSSREARPTLHAFESAVSYAAVRSAVESTPPLAQWDVDLLYWASTEHRYAPTTKIAVETA